MEDIKVFLDTEEQVNVNGIFYIFDSKYYFMYTLGEFDGNDYIKLYVSQVCKEVKNTATGPLETGYMLGMEISDNNEWKRVQESITKIVEDKKNGTQNSDIQYLPISMLVNLKIVSNNKFKLMKSIVQDNFKVDLSMKNNVNDSINLIENSPVVDYVEPVYETSNPEPFNINESDDNKIDTITNDIQDDVIIDYRARFFEEQEKNQQLEEQIKLLNEKLENIKNIIG